MLNIPRSLKAVANRWNPAPGLVFERPLVLLQSDDWGRVGVRDREGWELLRESGIDLGKRPYDFYSLETAEDVAALQETLLGHVDSTGRHPCVVMNFVTANVDFARVIKEDFLKLHLFSLADGFPGNWQRPGLLDAYRKGISDGVFYPALHGTTHFCRAAVAERIHAKDDASKLLQMLWRAETSYIYWRMPWIGYEYWNPKRREFSATREQEALVQEGAELFSKMFNTMPLSACAPGYRANQETRRAWAKCGVRVVQNGSGGHAAIHFNDANLLEVYRNVDFEPATAGEQFSLENCIRQARQNLDRGAPAVVSVHSINFHSTLRNFRGATLTLLDRFLTALKAKYPNLLYVSDADLYELAITGHCDGPTGRINVKVTQTKPETLRSKEGRG